MTSRLSSLALALLGGGLLAASIAGPAHAATWTHDDAVGDALVVDHLSDGTARPARTDPQERVGDITRMTVSYTADRLQVAASIRSIGALDASAAVKVVTSRGTTYTLTYLANDSTSAPYVFSAARNGCRYRCEGISVSRTSAGLLFRFPSSCLDDSYRLRTSLQTRMYNGYYDVDEREIRDDAQRTGRVDPTAPKLGPWVVRG